MGLPSRGKVWEDAAANIEAIGAEEVDSKAALHHYPEVFRRSLENEDSLCLGSFMAAEHDDLPPSVMREVRMFIDVNVAWLARMLIAAGKVDTEDAAEPRVRAIVASMAGAPLLARSRSDIGLFDNLVDAYREAGLLPS